MITAHLRTNSEETRKQEKDHATVKCLNCSSMLIRF